MSFFKDIEPYLDALRLYKSDRVYAKEHINKEIKDFYIKHIDENYNASHTCTTCLKTMYNVIIGEYDRRPKRGFKKKL